MPNQFPPFFKPFEKTHVLDRLDSRVDHLYHVAVMRLGDDRKFFYLIHENIHDSVAPVNIEETIKQFDVVDWHVVSNHWARIIGFDDRRIRNNTIELTAPLELKKVVAAFYPAHVWPQEELMQNLPNLPSGAGTIRRVSND